MSIVVSKSSPVAVASPPELGKAAGGIIHLSSLDKCYASLPASLLLVFDQPINDPVETIKKAVSQALVHYYPMAGRLVAGADDREPTHISCTGEGVWFVGPSASCTLEQVKTSPLLVGELAIRYPADYCRPGDALLLMQVTEFACGGFAVGVTWNHVVADGAGMAQFLRAVGELARGMPAPSVVPVRSEVDGSLPCLPPLVVAAIRSQMSVGTEEMASLAITVPWSLISRIKAECGGDCTMFDAVAALLWQCRTRAVVSDLDAPAPLFFPSSVRGLVGAKHGYYGNCVVLQPVQAKSGRVASGNVKDLVKLIRLAKEKTPGMLTSGGGGGGGGGGNQQPETPLPRRYNALLVTSLRNVGFEAVDFGRGGPARVTPPMCKAERTASNICVLCPPCSAKGKDGVDVVSLCVKPEHADAFVRELAALNA